MPDAVYNTSHVYVKEAEGSFIKDVDENVYIDFATGISSVNLGHRNPEVMNAIRKQLERYLHLCMHVTPYEEYPQLAAKLAGISPGSFQKKVVLVNTGAEAVENAVKVTRRYTGRPVILAFENAFHGRTRLAMSLTGSVHPYKYGFGPMDPFVHRTPYAYCYRCAFGLEFTRCGMRCLEYIRQTLAVHLSPDDVAAILVEPIQGEGGFIVPPTEFLQGLREICDDNNFLLIDDEVQSGMGRTGKMLAIEHSKVIPDAIALAKSLGGGLPIGATIARAEIMDSVQVGGLGGTFGGNPLSCVAALKSIEVVEQLFGNALSLGKLLRDRLEEFYDQYQIIGDVRGLGLMQAVELVKDRRSKKPAKEEESEIVRRCCENGLIILGAGIHKNVVRFLPALNIGKELLSEGLDIFEAALKTVDKKRK